ncbi:MAG TPA: hypothetical protein VN761_10300 [Candidatus Polarisedimenticolia bacterium]|nr:hypothetical protein [Candidatus Polarisedimenticolia bacterium]
MSTVAEIKAAIQRLSPEERNELEEWLHPDWDRPSPQNETPPGVREKLAEAARGAFSPGDRSNISKIRSKLK